MQVRGIILLTIISVLAVSNVIGTASKKIYIAPPSSKVCPENPCFSLSDVVKYPTQYFTSNTEVVFLPGNHRLNIYYTVVVQNVYNLSLIGTTQHYTNRHVVNSNSTKQHNSIVYCRGSGFAFYEITNLTIANLSFYHCGAEFMYIDEQGIEYTVINKYKNDPHTAVLHVVSALNVRVVNVSIWNSTGAALFGEDVHLLELENMTLYGNNQGISLENVNCSLRDMKFTTNYCAAVEVVPVYLNHYIWHDRPPKKRECNKIIHAKKSNVTFKGEVVFFDNEGAVSLSDSTITVQSRVLFIRNKGDNGGAVEMHNESHFNITHGAVVNFTENVAKYSGGGIALYGSSYISIASGARVNFINNTALYDGGAMALYSHSVMSIQPGAHINFEENYAHYYGGAIFFETGSSCFFEVKVEYTNLIMKVITNSTLGMVQLENNTAELGGDGVFGGPVDWCEFSGYNFGRISTFFSGLIFDRVFNFTSDSLSQVSSKPRSFCRCVSKIPQCIFRKFTVHQYPGSSFQVPAVAVGQREGTVASAVHATFFKLGSGRPSPRLGELQLKQAVRKDCTNLTYTVHSENLEEVLMLTLDEIDERKMLEGLGDKQLYELVMTGMDHFLKLAFITEETPIIARWITDIDVHTVGGERAYSPLIITIKLQPCPLGFRISDGTCICHYTLQKHRINCDINTQRVHRPNSYWINASNETGVIVHTHCPFDYCKIESNNISLLSPDEQCAFYRSGVLCGACQQGLSHVLGTSNCKECSNLWLLVLVPAFCFAGIALVVLLIALNLTVSVGTINGLIFYANIVRANQAAFFPPSMNNSFFSWFIAWLNLDFGVETCFYDGLDAYTKTWLQFAFPIYIWLIVFLIIVLSRYFTTAGKLAGRNAVPVLATLFLLSYAKLLRIVITAFSPALLTYPDNSVKKVWLYDGNIEYLKGKHIPLFMAGLLVLLGLSIPYTALLLFIQCLQARSRHRLLSWVHKLKPLFDAYTGPYKDKCRYWMGVLPLVRAIMFLIFSVNILGDPSINLLSTVICTACLLLAMSLLGGVYKSWPLNALEQYFIINLCIFSVSTLYARAADGSQSAVAYIFISLTFATFCGIVLYHTYVALSTSRTLKPHWDKLKQGPWGKRNTPPQPPPPPPVGGSTDVIQENRNYQLRPQVLGFNEFREPLLEYCDTGN